MQWVFGYGSLMYEPELPEAVEARRTGWLGGWRRRFNKRSITRGCLDPDALVPEGLPDWTDEELRLSLVLGTEPAPTSRLYGLTLGYSDSTAERLLARLSAREGPGYTHQEVMVHSEDGDLQAWTFLSDPRSDLIVDLSMDDVAEVLLAATPRVAGPRAQGAEYLLGVERFLARLGHPDPYITGLANRIRRLGEELRPG